MIGDVVKFHFTFLLSVEHRFLGWHDIWNCFPFINNKINSPSILVYDNWYTQYLSSWETLMQSQNNKTQTSHSTISPLPLPAASTQKEELKFTYIIKWIKFLPTRNIPKSGIFIPESPQFLFHSAHKDFNVSALCVPCLFVSSLGELVSAFLIQIEGLCPRSNTIVTFFSNLTMQRLFFPS